MFNHSRRVSTKGNPRVWIRYFLQLLRPFRLHLSWAVVAMMLDALLTALRPWPPKVVIDRVLSQKHSQMPLLAGWLDHASFGTMTILL
jgi:hypothetical protein